MPDYAINAIGHAAGEERLLGAGPSHEVLRFEKIGSRQSNAWDPVKGSWDQVRIIQEPSSSDIQLKKEKTPWDDMSTHVLDRLDDVQRRWRHVMQSSFSLDASSQADISGEDGPKAIQATLKKIFEAFYRLTDGQVRLTLVTSIATTAKNSISTLYRQQG